MTERELIDALCELRPTWAARRDEIHAAGIYHVDGGSLATELVDAVLAGADEPWMRRAFEVIERALEAGTEGTRTLVVIGLFEAMQNAVYERADPPDVLDAWLHPASQRAWGDLIESWTGRGIRTVAAWRAR